MDMKYRVNSMFWLYYGYKYAILPNSNKPNGINTGQMFVHNPYQELPGDYPSPQ